MFLTIYAKTIELDITSVVAITGDIKMKINSYQDKIFDSIKNGRFNCIRVIFERDTRYKGKEYHCVDFTGRSFIIIDPTGLKRDVKGVVDWIAAQDIKYGLTVNANPVTSIVGPDKRIERFPTTSEEYFHNYIRTEVQNYFQFPLEANNKD